MKSKGFIKVLHDKNIMYELVDGVIVIHSKNGYVDLRSLTSMPENVKFENQGNVDLESLTSMPENVKFENQGYVDLESLTSMPENVKFENQGNVYLRSLTSMPENVKFENQGYVYLRSLTSMPENVKFENQGNVYLRSLSGQTITYQGKKLSIKHIDGSTMIILKSKSRDDFTIHTAIYFKGGNIDKLPKCYIAQRGDYFAHGETIKECINDVQFKFMQNDLDVNTLVTEIKAKQTVSINEYRLLTGACSFGVQNFMKDNNIKEDELPLDKVIEITKGYYGGSRLFELFKSEG